MRLCRDMGRDDAPPNGRGEAGGFGQARKWSDERSTLNRRSPLRSTLFREGHDRAAERLYVFPNAPVATRDAEIDGCSTQDEDGCEVDRIERADRLDWELLRGSIQDALRNGNDLARASELGNALPRFPDAARGPSRWARRMARAASVKVRAEVYRPSPRRNGRRFSSPSSTTRMSTLVSTYRFVVTPGPCGLHRGDPGQRRS